MLPTKHTEGRTRELHEGALCSYHERVLTLTLRLTARARNRRCPVKGSFGLAPKQAPPMVGSLSSLLLHTSDLPLFLTLGTGGLFAWMAYFCILFLHPGRPSSDPRKPNKPARQMPVSSSFDWAITSRAFHHSAGQAWKRKGLVHCCPSSNCLWLVWKCSYTLELKHSVTKTNAKQAAPGM